MIAVLRKTFFEVREAGKKLSRPIGSGFGKSAAKLASASAAGSLLIIAVSPLLTRIYSEDDFGLLAVYGPTLSLLVPVAALRYEWALPSADERDVRDLFWLCAGLMCLSSITVTLAVLLVGDQYVELLGVPQLSGWMWLLPIGLAGGTLNQMLRMWTTRMLRYGKLARVSIATALVQSATQVGLGFAGVTPGGLLLGQIAVQWTGIRLLGVQLLEDFPPNARRSSLDRMKQVARRYRSFPLLSIPSSLLETGALHLTPLLVAGVYGQREAGLYFFAVRIVQTPVNLTASSLGGVFTGEAARMMRENPSAIRPFTVRLLARFFLLSLAPAVVLWFGAPWLFETIFGDNWKDAGMMAGVLSIAMVGQIMTAPLSLLPRIVRRQGGQLILDALRIAVIVGSFLLGATYGLDAIETITLLSGSILLLNLAIAGWYVHLTDPASLSAPVA